MAIRIRKLKKRREDIMSNETKLLEIAKQLIELNPKMAISGSLGLRLQLGEYRLRRECKDLDLYLPFGVELVKPKITTLVGATSDEDATHYDSETYERNVLKIDGFDIDVFTPVDAELNLYCTTVAKVPVVYFSDIIKMKIEHSFGKSWTKHKHKDDIIFLLSQIQ
jgi:hypothetical protein